MNKIEILAPVGGAQQLEAAVRSGADAVYLGGKGFNARRNAENFGETSLSDAVRYCHARGVRVHVTVNTLIMDGEMSALEQELAAIAESGADAAIVQDMAVMRLLRERCPALELHASTQAVVHNADGAKFMRDLGFRRVVLARELSLKEIETIANKVDVELEAFVHGALCTCLSGACYLSGMLGGRSGNRGLCAQPCRLDFKCGSAPYAISIKDMSHISAIRELADAGVTSFKIEGRMKRPEYVAAAVTACRSAAEGKPYDIDTLRRVFSRGGFTNGYLVARRGPEMQGVRTKEDAEASAEVLGSLRSLYRTERQSVPVDMIARVLKEKPLTLTAECEGASVTLAGCVPEHARSVAVSKESVQAALQKTGGTPFYLRSLEAQIDPGLSVPNAQWNALRRGALEELLAQREAPAPKDFARKPLPSFPPHAVHTQTLRARFETLAQVGDISRYESISLPVEEIARHPECIARFGGALVGELPAALFPEDEEKLDALVESLRDQGLGALITDNVYGIELGRRLGMTVHGGFGLNITNSLSLAEYEAAGLQDATVSFELHAQAVRALGGALKRGAIGYGYLPLMRLRRCPNRGKNGCGGCDGRPSLTDRKGVSFPLLCHERRYTTLLNSVPLWTADKPLRGVDFITLYFTTETAEQTERIARAHMAGDEPPFPHTYGLYGRTLL
ncbi:MAG: U32 family peptidase [Eubacteriales bacterium]|nr:U32 family peptidase [Eubacteriales bacterium]